MGIGAVQADARVEVQLIAVEPPSLLQQPVEQGTAVAPATGLRAGRKIVDVQVMPPGEVMSGAKAGHRHRSALPGLERRDQAVALGPLQIVDLPGEGPLVREVRAKAAHRLEGEGGLRRQQLADHGAILRSRADAARECRTIAPMPRADVSGTELHYERAGEGEAMLLIQGMSATHLAWGRPFLDQLEQSFDCVVFDNRGMGLSGPAEMPFTTADLAEDAVGLMDALGIGRAHIVAISMGGMAAQALALAHPERIRTLTIGASYCGGAEGTLMRPDDLQALGEAMASGDRERVYRAMWEINLSPGFRADDSRYAAFREMAAALPARREVILAQMRACGRHDCSGRLAEITAPTLVIHGSEDRLLSPSNGRQIAGLMSARLELMEGVGHLFWWEQPQRSAELIRDHALAAV
jgi:pimeloyl-ACP methyl ester carboxylesterase